MKILTAAEMRVTDQRTAQSFGVSSLGLMENAGRAVANFAIANFADAKHITVLCGGGNNGGDGFVTARLLREAGREVTVVMLSEPSALKGDARAVFEAASGQSVMPVIFLGGEVELETVPFEKLAQHTDLWIDAVVGTGFKPPLRGPAAALRDWLAPLKAPVLAIDLPSGWDADSRDFTSNESFRASAVVTFTAPKPAHVFGNLTGDAGFGAMVVAPIGSPEDAIQSASQITWAGSSKQIADAPRNQDSNKGRFGHVLVVGGAKGKAGAPSMASLAALRTGAGLVTAAISESILPTVARITPELMTISLIENGNGGISTRNLEDCYFEPILKGKTVIALGPGLGEEPETVDFILGLVNETGLGTDVPMVIDADALNALAAHPQHLDSVSRNGARTIVMTPHPGEMSRLINKPIPEIQANREQVARDFATRYQVTLVLKGARTLIAHPDGSIAVNTSGNPGMAKGGSGDILTGIVAAMIAQYPKQLAEAVNAAVYLHGLAADFAVREQNEHTLLATDTISHLFRAFRFQPDARDGYVWLRGFPPSS